MHYCLNKDELGQFLQSMLAGTPLDGQQLKLVIDSARSWQDELGIHNYLACLLLCRGLDDPKTGREIINLLYGLSDIMAVYIQELEVDFIQYLLRHLSPDALTSLEDSLVEMHAAWRERNYRRALRY